MYLHISATSRNLKFQVAKYEMTKKCHSYNLHNLKFQVRMNVMYYKDVLDQVCGCLITTIRCCRGVGVCYSCTTLNQLNHQGE